MIKKINKKLLFRISAVLSAFIAVFAGTAKDDAGSKPIEVANIPLFSIEKAFAEGGSPGDCCGSSDGGVSFPQPSSSGLGIKFSAPSGGGFSCGGGGCFVAGTPVVLADGSEKAIETITTSDVVKTSGVDQPVMRTYTIPYSGLLYAFNGSGQYFVTPSHPFMTKAGWKSINPAETAKETPDLSVETLTVGDEILQADGTTFTLVSLESAPFTTTVYNFDVNDSHDYYAAGHHAHNVSMKLIKTAEANILQK